MHFHEFKLMYFHPSSDVQLTETQHWFGQWNGANSVPSLYLKQSWYSLPLYIDGLVQERRNWSYVFLALSHRYICRSPYMSLEHFNGLRKTFLTHWSYVFLVITHRFFFALQDKDWEEMDFLLPGIFPSTLPIRTIQQAALAAVEKAASPKAPV